VNFSNLLQLTNSGGRAVQGVSLRPPACWYCGLDSRWGHACLSVVRGLCDELITRPEESCRLWCIVVCDPETSMKKPWLALGRGATEKKKSVFLLAVNWKIRARLCAVESALFIWRHIQAIQSHRLVQWVTLAKSF